MEALREKQGAGTQMIWMSVYFQLLEKHNGALKPSSNVPDDKRLCILCGETGDGENNASAR